MTYQTAKSLSEMTRGPGVVSFVDCRIVAELPGMIRIAATRNFPLYASQLVESNPFPIYLAGYLSTSEPERTEKEIREKFAGSHSRGAWYRPTCDLLDFISKQTLKATAPPPIPSSVSSNPVELLSVDEVAEQLQMSAPTVRRWINDGKIPVIRQGRLLRFYMPDVLTALRTGIMPPKRQ